MLKLLIILIAKSLDTDNRHRLNLGQTHQGDSPQSGEGMPPYLETYGCSDLTTTEQLVSVHVVDMVTL